MIHSSQHAGTPQTRHRNVTFVVPGRGGDDQRISLRSAADALRFLNRIGADYQIALIARTSLHGGACQLVYEGVLWRSRFIRGGDLQLPRDAQEIARILHRAFERFCLDAPESAFGTSSIHVWEALHPEYGDWKDFRISMHLCLPLTAMASATAVLDTFADSTHEVAGTWFCCD